MADAAAAVGGDDDQVDLLFGGVFADLHMRLAEQSLGDRRCLQASEVRNLEIRDGGQIVWTSETAGLGATQAIFQGDGNFVLYTAANQAVWATNTSQGTGTLLSLQDDGNLVVLAGQQEL